MIARSHPHGHAAARGSREHHADHTLESLGHEGAAHLLAERGDLRVLLVLHRRGDVGHQAALIGAEAELLEDGLAHLRGDGHDHHHEHHDVVGLGRHRRLGRLGMERRDGKGQCFHGVRLDSVLVGGAIEARFVASVRGYGSHAGAHLHLGHVIRLLHELDGLLERIWAGEGRDGTVRGDGERTRAADRFAFWRGS